MSFRHRIFVAVKLGYLLCYSASSFILNRIVD